MSLFRIVQIGNIGILVCIILAILFQNCGPGFDTADVVRKSRFLASRAVFVAMPVSLTESPVE